MVNVYKANPFWHLSDPFIPHVQCPAQWPAQHMEPWGPHLLNTRTSFCICSVAARAGPAQLTVHRTPAGGVEWRAGPLSPV